MHYIAVHITRARAVRRVLRGPAELGRAHCAGRAKWAAHSGRASATSMGRAPRGRGPCTRVAAGRTRVVQLGRAWFRPSGTRIRFYIF
jgi:hypothetical protein